MKSDFMRGTTDESHGENPTVRSKFDKSQGKGLPAPHLTHPGEVAKETGSKHTGFNENGHMMPKDVSMAVGDDGKHQVTLHTPDNLGTGMAEGRGYAKEPNVAATDHIVAKSRTVPMDRFGGREPDPVRAGTLKHDKQHPTGHVNPRMGGGTDRLIAGKQVRGGERVDRPSQKRDSGALAGDTNPRRGYYGGKGKM